VSGHVNHTLIEKTVKPNINDEVWETTTGGTVWVEIPDSRGDMRQVKVGGRRGAKLRIATEDRVSRQVQPPKAVQRPIAPIDAHLSERCP
jgi:hypothetical protein